MIRRANDVVAFCGLLPTRGGAFNSNLYPPGINKKSSDAFIGSPLHNVLAGGVATIVFDGYTGRNSLANIGSQ